MIERKIFSCAAASEKIYASKSFYRKKVLEKNLS